MADRKTAVHDQAWFDAAFRLIRAAPEAQAEVELRCLIRDVGTAAMARAMRIWLEARAKLETPAAPRGGARSPPRPSPSWAPGVGPALSGG